MTDRCAFQIKFMSGDWADTDLLKLWLLGVLLFSYLSWLVAGISSSFTGVSALAVLVSVVSDQASNLHDVCLQIQLATVGLISLVVFNSGKAGCVLFVLGAMGCNGLCCQTARAAEEAEEHEHAKGTEAAESGSCAEMIRMPSETNFTESSAASVKIPVVRK